MKTLVFFISLLFMFQYIVAQPDEGLLTKKERKHLWREVFHSLDKEIMKQKVQEGAFVVKITFGDKAAAHVISFSDAVTKKIADQVVSNIVVANIRLDTAIKELYFSFVICLTCGGKKCRKSMP